MWIWVWLEAVDWPYHHWSVWRDVTTFTRNVFFVNDLSLPWASISQFSLSVLFSSSSNPLLVLCFNALFLHFYSESLWKSKRAWHWVGWVVHFHVKSSEHLQTEGVMSEWRSSCDHLGGGPDSYFRFLGNVRESEYWVAVTLIGMCPGK